MEKKTKVKISLIVIPFIVILLIVGVAVLIISINKMQKEDNNNENLTKQVTENTSNTSDSNKKDNSTSNKKVRKEEARDALTLALAEISTKYYDGDFENANELKETLTSENLEKYASKYIYKVSWNKKETSATVRMQLKKDDSSQIYVAEVDENLVILEFEEDEENDTSKDSDSNKSENKKGSSGVLERADKEKLTTAAKEASARESLTMALYAITSKYYSGDFDNKENKLTDDLTVEKLEEYAPEYVYEVSWNKGRVPTATVRMQLKSDDTSPIYRAEVTEQLTLANFEEEEENE